MSSKRIIYSQQFSSDIYPTSEGYRFRFRKNSYACASMIVVLFRAELMGNVIVFNNEGINLIHFFAISAFLFLPLMYMFLFVGHYSRLGCLVFTRVIPVINGVGYTMLVISCIQLVYGLCLAADSLELLHSEIEGDWTKCHERLGAGCIYPGNMDNCAKTKCFRDISQFSLYRYYMFVWKKIIPPENSATINAEVTKSDYFWRNVEGRRVPYLFICVIIALLITDLDVSSNKKFCGAICLFYLVTMFLLIFGFSLNVKNPSEVLKVFKINGSSLMNLDCWVSTVLRFVRYINLCDVSTVLIGSYLPGTSMTDLQGFLIWIGIMCLYSSGEFMACVMSAALASKVGVTSDKIRTTSDSYIVASILFPESLISLKYGATPLCYLYLIFIIVSSLSRIRIVMAAAYHSVADTRPIIRSYKFYIRIFSSGFLFILAFPMCVTGLHKYFMNVLQYLEIALSTLVLVLITLGVLYIYGVQTLCDDHHFLYGSQPAVFFKVTLYIAPVCLFTVGAVLFVRLSSLFTIEPVVSRYLYILFPVLIIPQIAGLLYITTYYLKRQNMAHLLRCEENWGDPSAQTRKERIIYHPRKETNYFRRIDVCKHDCLRYNRILPFVIKDEEIVQNEGYNSLKSHERVLTEAEVGSLHLVPSDTD